MEVFRFAGLGQVSYVSVKPGAVRGNHYHTRKKETFCVVKGTAKIRQRNRETNDVEERTVNGEAPELVDMKLNWAHSIKNTGEGEMEFLIWANEVFDPADPDTFAEKA